MYERKWRDALWFWRFIVPDAHRRVREKLLMRIAWGLPRCLAYWCAIRVMAHATTGQYGATNPTELSVTDALQRWDDK